MPPSAADHESLGTDEHTVYSEGYATVEQSGAGFDWVCRYCFDDLAEELDFVVVADPSEYR